MNSKNLNVFTHFKSIQKSYLKPQHCVTGPTIRVPNVCDKLHFWWPEGVIFGKCQMSFKHTTFTVNSKIKSKKNDHNVGGTFDQIIH